MAKNILVIDDDEILRNSLAKGLRTAGFTVLNASSAEYADQVLSRITVDAIVLDRMMTGMDGLSFLRKLRQTGNETPVIMLTAMSGAENTIDGLSSGANDYMSKPFQLQELILRLNNIIKSDKKQVTSNIGLMFVDDEFFIHTVDGTKKMLTLSNEEKKLLQNLISPIGNIAPATPMVAKRLRNKINSVSSCMDIITVRGMGYKMISKEN